MPDECLKMILDGTDDSFDMLDDDHIDPDYVPCSDSSDCTENFIPVGLVTFSRSNNLQIDENSSSNVVPPLSPVIPLIDDRASSQLQGVPSPIDPSGPLTNNITDYPFPRTSFHRHIHAEVWFSPSRKARLWHSSTSGKKSIPGTVHFLFETLQGSYCSHLIRET